MSEKPRRRYPDLITQRLLKAAMARHAQPYGNDELASLAKHCTEEDAAKKVERQITESAAAMLLESRIVERFDAIVTGASENARGSVFCIRPLKEDRRAALKDWISVTSSAYNWSARM